MVRRNKQIIGKFILKGKFQFIEENKILIEIKIKISPIRFLMIVIDPDAADE
jgi:hypothetical protein